MEEKPSDLLFQQSLQASKHQKAKKTLTSTTPKPKSDGIDNDSGNDMKIKVREICISMDEFKSQFNQECAFIVLTEEGYKAYSPGNTGMFMRKHFMFHKHMDMCAYSNYLQKNNFQIWFDSLPGVSKEETPPESNMEEKSQSSGESEGEISTVIKTEAETIPSASTETSPATVEQSCPVPDEVKPSTFNVTNMIKEDTEKMESSQTSSQEPSNFNVTDIIKNALEQKKEVAVPTPPSIESSSNNESDEASTVAKLEEQIAALESRIPAPPPIPNEPFQPFNAFPAIHNAVYIQQNRDEFAIAMRSVNAMKTGEGGEEGGNQTVEPEEIIKPVPVVRYRNEFEAAMASVDNMNQKKQKRSSLYNTAIIKNRESIAEQTVERSPTTSSVSSVSSATPNTTPAVKPATTGAGTGSGTGTRTGNSSLGESEDFAASVLKAIAAVERREKGAGTSSSTSNSNSGKRSGRKTKQEYVDSASASAAESDDNRQEGCRSPPVEPKTALKSKKKDTPGTSRSELSRALTAEGVCDSVTAGGIEFDSDQEDDEKKLHVSGKVFPSTWAIPVGGEAGSSTFRGWEHWTNREILDAYDSGVVATDTTDSFTLPPLPGVEGLEEELTVKRRIIGQPRILESFRKHNYSDEVLREAIDMVKRGGRGSITEASRKFNIPWSTVAYHANEARRERKRKNDARYRQRKRVAQQQIIGVPPPTSKSILPNVVDDDFAAQLQELKDLHKNSEQDANKQEEDASGLPDLTAINVSASGRKKAYSTQDLIEAVEQVVNHGVRVSDACRQYNIPSTTLREHVKIRKDATGEYLERIRARKK